MSEMFSVPELDPAILESYKKFWMPFVDALPNVPFSLEFNPHCQLEEDDEDFDEYISIVRALIANTPEEVSIVFISEEDAEICRRTNQFWKLEVYGINDNLQIIYASSLSGVIQCIGNDVPEAALIAESLFTRSVAFGMDSNPHVVLEKSVINFVTEEIMGVPESVEDLTEEDFPSAENYAKFQKMMAAREAVAEDYPNTICLIREEPTDGRDPKMLITANVLEALVCYYALTNKQNKTYN